MTTRYRAKSSGGGSLANEVVAVLIVAAAVLLFLSFITYDPKDPSWNSVGAAEKPQNLIGLLGAYVADFFLQLFGLAALVIPVLMTLIAARVFFSDSARLPVRKAIGALLLLLVHSGFLALFSKADLGLLERSRSNGGAVGYVVEGALASFLNTIGAAIVLAVASVLTLMLTMEISLATFGRWVNAIRAARAESRKGKPTMFQRLSAWWAKRAEQRRLQAEEQEKARAEQERQKEEERRRREREAQALLAQQRKEIAEQRKRQEEERRSRALEPVIADPIIKSTAAEPSLEPPLVAETADEIEPEIAEPRRILSPTRREMAEVLRARAARNERVKAGPAVAAEVTMDPDVVEMTSTAWIERTAPTDKVEPSPAGAGAKAVRRKAAVETTTGTIYKLPALDLLETPIGHHEQAEEELRERATILAEKCKEFSVTGHIHRINPGPVVTTFEFKPDPGIKYSRVVSLAEDLCLALKAESIRIDRIPGKSTVGIEVPNSHRETIYLREVIESAKFQNTESKL
ncbi:MAG TPA: DNA translocase FtsK 4TM domain-containing protein, partial [Blastocatellia bacterium]|nr:DNA translocase FtsK 4TM domain-containing protein [Blastocatellia bacterium]